MNHYHIGAGRSIMLGEAATWRVGPGARPTLRHATCDWSKLALRQAILAENTHRSGADERGPTWFIRWKRRGSWWITGIIHLQPRSGQA